MSNANQINYEDDRAGVTVSNEDLGEISALADRMLELELRISYHSSVIESLKDDYQHLEREDLPEAMKRCGMEKFTLANGVAITIKDDVSVSIPKANENKAFEWLEENGNGAMIKAVFAFQFDRTDEEKMKEFKDFIAGSEYNEGMASKQSVPAQTLKAFFRGYLEEHGEFSDELKKLFGLYDYQMAKLKIPETFTYGQ